MDLYLLLQHTLRFGFVTLVLGGMIVNVGYCYNVEGNGDWWNGEYRCLRNGGTHLASIYDSVDLADFKSKCGSGNNCWIGLNNYYNSDSEWFWLSYGFHDDTGLEILSFYQLTGLNVSESDNNNCVFYNGVSETFEFCDCGDKSLNYYFICDDNYDDDYTDARRRYVTLPYKTNWFNAQKFCMSLSLRFCVFFCLLFFFFVYNFRFSFNCFSFSVFLFLVFF